VRDVERDEGRFVGVGGREQGGEVDLERGGSSREVEDEEGGEGKGEWSKGIVLEGLS
jgi:hypothetical protein